MPADIKMLRRENRDFSRFRLQKRDSKSIRAGQAGFSSQQRFFRRKAFASTASFRMMAVIASLAGLPA